MQSEGSTKDEHMEEVMAPGEQELVREGDGEQCPKQRKQEEQRPGEN